MTGQWLHFIKRIKDAVYARWYLRAAFYAAIVAAIFVTWLSLSSGGVAFIYSEF